MKNIRFASIYLLTLAIIFFALGTFLELHFFHSYSSLMAENDRPIDYRQFIHLVFFLLGFLILVTIYLIEKRETKILKFANRALEREVFERERFQIEREELIGELQKALDRVKLLSGLLPICTECKKVRDDQGYWSQIESFIRDHSEAEFTHSLCPGCAKKLYPDMDLDDGGKPGASR